MNSENSFNPYITVRDGERRIVPLAVNANVEPGGVAIVNAFAVATFKRGSIGYVMKNANVTGEPGCLLYLQVNTSYLASLPGNLVLHGLDGVPYKDFYDMPEWFWHRKDRGSLGFES